MTVTYTGEVKDIMPRRDEVRIIVVVARGVRERERENAVKLFNLIKADKVHVNVVTWGDALAGYPADMVVIADTRHYMTYDNWERAETWKNEVLRLRLKPDGLWIER